MKYFLLLMAACFFLSSSAAASPELKIDAEEMSYLADKIEAKGSVEATYTGMMVSGPHLLYDLKTSSIMMDKGFNLKYNGTSVSGIMLNYDLVKKAGSAESVKINYDKNINFTGSRVSFAPEKISLKDSSFNACGLDPPHYEIAASQMDFFPKQGWLIATWGSFRLGSLPPLPIPVYMYDVMAAERGAKNMIPLPVMGSNDQDGFFINDTLGWYTSENLYGDYTLTYAQKKGLGAGATANQIYNEFNRTQIALMGYSLAPFSGHLVNDFSFGRETDQKGQTQLSSVFFRQISRQFDLQTKFSLRETVNNTANVSFLPRVQLKLNTTAIGPVDVSGALYTGLTSEEAIQGSYLSSGLIGSASWPFFRQGMHELRLDGQFEGRHYLPVLENHNSYQYWLFLRGGLRADQKWRPNFATHLGYIHYLANKGGSPFKFEKYKFVSDDQAYIGFDYSHDKITLGAEALYNIVSSAPIDIDCSAALKFHCYEVSILYRIMRSEFAFGFNFI